MKTTEFICTVCKEHKKHESDITTGHATNKAGDKICFDCVKQIDLDSLVNLKKGEKICFYLVKEGDKYKVTNWPGTMVLNVDYVRKGKHNMAISRYDIWFTLERHLFHGVQYGENTQVCHIKKLIK